MNINADYRFSTTVALDITQIQVAFKTGSAHLYLQLIYLLNSNMLKKSYDPALAGVSQWIEHWPVNQRIAGLIPGQGFPGLWARSPLEVT